MYLEKFMLFKKEKKGCLFVKHLVLMHKKLNLLGFCTSINNHFIYDIQQDGHITDNRSETSQGTVVPDGKMSMMEFAMMNFRESLQK